MTAKSMKRAAWPSMATSGYNEADTRAKLIDPALHARQ